MSLSLQDIIAAGPAFTGAGMATIRAYIADREGDIETIAAEARTEIARIRAEYESDAAITPELAALVQLVVRATEPEPAAEPETDPVAETEDDNEDTTEPDPAETAAVGDNTTEEEVTVTDSHDETTPVTGELVGAGTGPASGETFARGRVMDLGSMRTNVPILTNGDALATNDKYEVFASGSSKTIETVRDLGDHVSDKMKMIASSRGTDPTGVSLVTYKAKSSWDRPHRTAGMSDKDVVNLMDRSVSEHNGYASALFEHGKDSPEAAAFASTGWCAPSVDNFEFCPVPSPWGLFGDALPTITSERGGNRWPITPPLSDKWGDGIGCWTEAEEMARVDPKPCVELDCPGWVDFRDNVCSICVTSSILTNRAFPEWVGNQMAAYELMYELWINWQMLQTALGYARPVRWTTAGWGVWAALKEKIAFAIDSLSARHLLDPQGHVWNLAVPYWLYGMIQADLSKRVGNDIEMMSVSRDRINVMLGGGRQLRIWPLSIWQTAITQTDIPDPAMRTWMGSDLSLDSGNYPETAEMLLWPQGAFVAVRDDFLDIRARWDYGLQRDNKQLQMFSETQWNVIPRCYEALHITLDVCTAGRSGSMFEYPCNEVVPA